MNDERDMFYNSYGYSAAVPGPMMNGMPMSSFNPGMNAMPDAGMFNPNMMMNANPNANMGNTGYNGAMGNASYNSYNNMENRITNLEKEMRKLEQRVYALERPHTNNTTNIYNEPDSNMYMI